MSAPPGEFAGVAALAVMLVVFADVVWLLGRDIPRRDDKLITVCMWVMIVSIATLVATFAFGLVCTIEGIELH